MLWLSIKMTQSTMTGNVRLIGEGMSDPLTFIIRKLRAGMQMPNVLSPFYTVWEPSTWILPLQLAWTIPPQLTQFRNYSLK